MKLYKVLNKDLTSPYQGFQFELGKKYVCDDFDTSGRECSKGFYAVDFNGLVYAINNGGQKHSVFEDELADVVLRVTDLCGLLGIDLETHIKAKMRYNATRPYKHNKAY